MKKVGILTFQYANNYGAVLQAYALRKKINSLEGYEAEIINYVPEEFSYSLPLNTEESYENMLKKRTCFERFLNEYCGIKKPMIHKVCGNEYDYYCVGSDQVWNFQMESVNVNYLFAYLDEIAVKFAYAASIGMNIESARVYKKLFAQYVSKFKGVSLREQEQVSFISEVSGLACRTVADPTLLLKAEEYKGIIAKNSLRDKPFLFFFWLPHDHELMKGVEFVNMLARKYDISIVHSIPGAAPYMFCKDDGCMMYEGVENFLWYIQNAKIVVTNSYHAMLFSMQFQTPFYAFAVHSMRSRFDMLIEKMGIGSRMVDSYKDATQVSDVMDFSGIQQQIVCEREDSLVFLKKMLDIKEG